MGKNCVISQTKPQIDTVWGVTKLGGDEPVEKWIPMELFDRTETDAKEMWLDVPSLYLHVTSH